MKSPKMNLLRTGQIATKASLLASLLLASICAVRVRSASINAVKVGAPIGVATPISPSAQNMRVPLESSENYGGMANYLNAVARSRSIELVRQGCRLDKQGKHALALEKFGLAVQVDSNYDTALSNFITACLVNGELTRGRLAAKDFLRRFSSSPRCHEVACMMHSMQGEWKRRQLTQQCVGLPVGPETSDYLAYQLAQHVRLWPDYLLPLKVYVASGIGVNQYRPSFKKDLIDSFNEWANGCHGQISFQFVEKAEQANIECEWIDDPSKFPTHMGIEGGETVPYYNCRGLAHAKILLLTTSRANSGKALEAAMRHVCLHEIGHALGLLEHSDSPGDIMFYAFQGDDHTRPKLSKRDLVTLVRLYESEQGNIAELSRLPAPLANSELTVQNTEASKLNR